MGVTKIHIKKKEGRRTYYSYFDNVQLFNDFVDEQTTSLNNYNRGVLKQMNQKTASTIKKGSRWYGSPIPRDVSELNAHKYFLGMELLRTISAKIKDKLNQYIKLMGNQILSKPKVAYNDRGLGMFCFDRAAMGLYRLQPTVAKRPIENTINQLQIELDTSNKTTAVKSVYAYFKDRKSSYPALKLYLMAGGNAAVEGDALLYVGLACAELVEFMEIRGVAVEVNALLGTSFYSNVVMGVIRIKRFQDRLDKNQLLLMTSDPRYFRYRGFKSLIALSNHFGLDIPAGLGSMKVNMGKDFVEEVMDKQEGYAVFEQSYSIDAAVGEVTQIIENYTQQTIKK
ncbi:hypothetical protein HN014_04380 [Aquimarina sp. TRL1]|uniref:DUF7192 family protein n=1 Tax=Aquimarina sp. (strain TRL1) TaxID=2736252 RepID=UPI00158E5FAE|nr:hypothetical protein [Aquimarina sp. TRL1]QKX04175.1 hypothetical protein HN014_04380 [Aquimarina sp. TRL1]